MYVYVYILFNLYNLYTYILDTYISVVPPFSYAQCKKIEV